MYICYQRYQPQPFLSKRKRQRVHDGLEVVETAGFRTIFLSSDPLPQFTCKMRIETVITLRCWCEDAKLLHLKSHEQNKASAQCMLLPTGI